MKTLIGGVTGFLSEFRQMRGTNVWIFIVYGLLFDTLNNLWRPFSVKFLERLGGSEFEIALLSALPGLVAAAVLLPGAILFRRFTNKKRATATFILISRAMLLGIAFIPFLPAAARPMLFVILIAVMNCPDALSQTSLQNFMGTLFSGHMRGQAIALRTKFGQAAVPIVTILSGLIITFIPRTDEQRIILYQIFFTGAFLLGIVEVTVFNRFKVPEYMHQQEEAKEVVKISDFTVIKGILRDKKFKRFLIPTILFAFTWQAGWPLLGILQVIHLGATEMWLAVFGLITGICAFLSGSIWQKLLRKYGNNTVFVISGIMLSFNVFIFAVMPNVQFLMLANVSSGLSILGIQMALLNGALEASPDENRMTYLAFFNTVMSISLFAAPFAAHFLLTSFGLIRALYIVGIMRFGGTFIFWLCYKFRKTL